ncbi:hypothetical protein GCM10009682_00370 [Luedemannella flava]|uniref:Uncharacterized protein n=1 Tax=Luedemannella flava TaxID=349316 RepID=A0ABN2LAW2_9ACTN
MSQGERRPAADDADRVAASLGEWIDAASFADRDADQVTGLLVDAVVEWGRTRHWRVYRRAPSVVPLPAPYSDRFSVVDVGIARAGAAPIVVEVDSSDRQRTLDKLVAEARAGRVALWVRWGRGPFRPPPPPVRLVTCVVTSRRDPATGRRLHSSRSDRLPAPQHSDVDLDAAEQGDLFGGEQ